MSQIEKTYREIMESIARGILTDAQKSKYCLIFGQRVIGEYDTVEEAIHAQTTEYALMITILITPETN